MVVEEIQVTAGKTVDLRKRVVHPLGVERATAGEERILVAEVAALRTAPCHHYLVAYEVVAAANEIPADRGRAFERPPVGRLVAAGGSSGAEFQEKPRKGLFA